ncbi:hypothetical protein CUREO_1250 [Campylobacter ureolyticus RIGS 9880]|uniref:Uncharacterized protein n=1 Tax=Campylobacter ureolyticus RIGS 9880 TaxID=1032069 RepID=A0AAU8UEN8_9BACT|nr:hypothetical protein [Campylobacter ureolyticus]AKT91094.1 hypothetical protein CUREO_1250 [Campylobacter ureolyticus RIGS 9880]
MIIFDEEIIKLDIVDLDYILSPYCGDCQTLIVNKSSEKKIYLLREQTIGDENYSDVVLGISKDIKEIKSKMAEYVEDNEQYPYFYRLVGDIDKEEVKLRGSLSGFETIENKKRLKVEYKTYKTKTELGEIFLVDVLIKAIDDDELMSGEINFVFFNKEEMKNFMNETFRDKITQEVFEY